MSTHNKAHDLHDYENHRSLYIDEQLTRMREASVPLSASYANGAGHTGVKVNDFENASTSSRGVTNSAENASVSSRDVTTRFEVVGSIAMADHSHAHFSDRTQVFQTDIRPLFTNENDVVDFNKVLAGSYTEGTQYNALDGDDLVVLPDDYQKAGLVLLADFYGGKGDDTILGGSDTDHIIGGEGNDRIYGGGNGDKIYGGDGDDQLDGGEGRDYLYGGLGNDTLIGGKGEHDCLVGEEGNDVLFGGIGEDDMKGGEGDDIIYGGDSTDIIEAGAGDDLIMGGDGQDFISPQGGKDVIYGGADEDNFFLIDKVETVELADVIEDFEDGIDKIYLPLMDVKDMTIDNVGQDVVLSWTNPYGAHEHVFVAVIKNAAGQIDAADFG